MRLPSVISISISAACIVSCSDESMSRAGTPQTRAEAINRLDIPLPASAHAVYYLDYAGGLQDLERFIRFEADPQEIDSAVDAIVAANIKTMGRAFPYPRRGIDATALPSPRKEFLPMKWWNPESAKRGYYRGHTDAYALRILVDEGNSRIYIYQND